MATAQQAPPVAGCSGPRFAEALQEYAGPSGQVCALPVRFLAWVAIPEAYIGSLLPKLSHMGLKKQSSAGPAGVSYPHRLDPSSVIRADSWLLTTPSTFLSNPCARLTGAGRIRLLKKHRCGAPSICGMVTRRWSSP